MEYFNKINSLIPFEQEILEEKFKKMWAGDQIARQELIEHNIALVIFIAKQYNITDYNRDYDIYDLISIGTIGLIKAIDQFDIAKGQFGTYAGRCIKNEILMYFRKMIKYRGEKYGGEVSLNIPLKIDKAGYNILVEDLFEDVNQDFVLKYENEAVYKEIRNFVKELPEREKYITIMLFEFSDKRMNQNELAEQLGISQSRVSRIRKQVLEKATEYLIKIDNIDLPKRKVLSIKEQ